MVSIYSQGQQGGRVKARARVRVSVRVRVRVRILFIFSLISLNAQTHKFRTANTAITANRIIVL